MDYLQFNTYLFFFIEGYVKMKLRIAIYNCKKIRLLLYMEVVYFIDKTPSIWTWLWIVQFSFWTEEGMGQKQYLP